MLDGIWTFSRIKNNFVGLMCLHRKQNNLDQSMCFYKNRVIQQATVSNKVNKADNVSKPSSTGKNVKNKVEYNLLFHRLSIF